MELEGKGLGKWSWFEQIGVDDNDGEVRIDSGQVSQWLVGMFGMLIRVTNGPKHPLEVVSTSKIKGSAKVAVAFLKGKTVSWKTSSLEMKMFLVVKSNTLYPSTPKGYPKKTHFLALGANLDLLCERVEA